MIETIVFVVLLALIVFKAVTFCVCMSGLVELESRRELRRIRGGQ